MIRWMRRAVAGAAIVLAVGVTGCSTQPSPEPSPIEPSPTATEPAGRRYALPERMCDKVDVTAFKDLYPEEEREDQHLLNTDDACSTAVIAGPGRVVSLTLRVELTPDYDEYPELTRTYYESELAIPTTKPVAIDGVGTQAAWYGNKHEAWLYTFDANANLSIRAKTVNDTHELPDDVAERLVRVAAATLDGLAQ